MARKPNNPKSKKALTRLGEWKPVFIKHLARMGNVTRAIKAAGINIDTAYEHRKTDEKFARQWTQALRQSGDVLEAEAWRRAVKGTAKPVFHQGAPCGSIQEYSDTLLIFLLKGNKPKKFRENIRAELTGKNGGAVKVEHNGVDLSRLNVDQLRQLRELRIAAEKPSEN